MTAAAAHPFSEWLASYGAGSLDDKLTAGLAERAGDVVLLDKPGTLTLKLTVQAKGGGVVVTPGLKLSPPESKDGGQFFYVDAEGNLSRRDPNQPQLPTMEDKK